MPGTCKSGQIKSEKNLRTEVGTSVPGTCQVLANCQNVKNQTGKKYLLAERPGGFGPISLPHASTFVGKFKFLYQLRAWYVQIGQHIKYEK